MNPKRVTIRTYVIAMDPYRGWAKIGKTHAAPRYRLAELQISTPYRLRVVAEWRTLLISGRPVLDVEQILHAHFAPLRGLGEWFALPAALLMDMASSDRDKQGFLDVMERWPARRVLDLAEGESTLEALADQFAAPVTRHEFATPKLRKVDFAG